MKNNQKLDISIRKRCVFFTGVTDEESTKDFINSVFKLELEDPSKDILILIDSYGGYVDSMWAMIDVMNLCRCKIHTLCVGKAMSAASLMLMNGTKGKRYCTPNSRIMLHKVSAWHGGNFDDLDIQMKETKRIEEKLEDFIIKNSKLNKGMLSKVLKNDFYLDPPEAKKNGIIDKIITNFSEIKLQGW
jgi:ATP-dependent Clp protease, protease subunit